MINRLLQDQPTFHQTRDGTAARWDALPGTLRLIERLAEPGMRTVETGSGASTVVFAAAGCDHTAISPHRQEHERIAAYCDEVGIPTDRLTFVADTSDRALPDIAGTVDLSFIDGAHRFPAPIVDWHYLSALTPVSGVVILDDVPIPSVRVAHDFMSYSPNWEMIAVADRRAVAWRRTQLEQSGDPWAAERLRRRYPDMSFLPWPERIRVAPQVGKARLRQAVRRAADGFPSTRMSSGGGT